MNRKVIASHLINRFYYNVRPAIPRKLQIALRRIIASRKLKANSDAWPIYPGSEIPPIGWPGWPENKQFALVLTHDIETIKGQSRCLDVVRLEKDLNFRSAFNFVAERYPVSTELRNFLVADGFEVGLHGLYHDGKKFKSRRIFNERAPKINHYLREWNASGFRSPAMHFNLDWIHDLNIKYDCSTFDTDPFEPQSTGVGTIFPFFVHGKPGGKGYVELPYTLVQDFTLFVILKQESIDIWKRKLDWIAEKGGMALILAHPDYMSFNGKQSLDEYPASRYKELLEYVKDRYMGRYWNALPGEVADFYNQEVKRDLPPRPEKHNRVCMPVYSFYETDNRVIRYAETLAKRGDQVDVIALRKKGQPYSEVLNGVRVFRVQEREKNEKRNLDYLARLIRFFFLSGALVTKKHLENPYDLIHVHSVPDFEVFAALVPRMFGAKIILDIHDIVPEFYASKFGGGSRSIFFKLLLLVEKLSVRFSDHVIISNHLWWETLVNRSVGPEKCTVILNYPDPDIFRKRAKSRTDGKKIVMYPGTLNYHQGIDIAIRAFSRISEELPEAELHIYGGGDQLDSLVNLAAKLALDGRVKFFGSIPLYEIAHVMANSDLGIVPKRSNTFGNEAFSTKVLEFMSLGVPVLVSSTRIDQFYFNDDVVHFFKAQDENDLADRLLFLLKNESFRKTLSAKALAFAGDFSWGLKKSKYLDLVDSLIVSIK
jgi:glycosyltransferase involved in cell wall biosynthesis